MRWPYHLVAAYFHWATGDLLRARTRQLHWDYKMKDERRSSTSPLLREGEEQCGALLTASDAEASQQSRNSSVSKGYRNDHFRSGSTQEHDTLGISVPFLHASQALTQQHFQDPQLNLPIFTSMMHDSESQEKTTGTWPREPPPDESSGTQRSMLVPPPVLVPRASYSRGGSLDPQLDAPEPTH